MAAAPDPDEALRSTEEKANFQRITRLLICGGTSLVREIFDNIHPPPQLPTILSNPATEKLLKAAKLSKTQWDCLYISPGVYGKSTDFDVTLLLRLLRTICNLTPPTKGWDVLPVSTDCSLTADLARIKYYRNSVYGHVNQNMDITNDQFHSYWVDISETLVRIAGQISHKKKTAWQGAIDQFLKNPLTAEDDRNVKELLRWYNNDMKVKKLIEDLKTTTEENVQCLKKTVREEAQDIKTTTEKVLAAVEQESFVIEQKVQCLQATVQEEARDMRDLKTKIETVVCEEAKEIKDQLGEIHHSIDKLSSSAAGQSAGARLRLRIDCETIAGPNSQGDATGTVIIPQVPQAAVQEAAVVPVTTKQPQQVLPTSLVGESAGQGSLPSSQETLNFIAIKYFQNVDPSTPDEFNGFLQYMEKVRKVIIVDAKSGSLIITVECSCLQILDELWEDYCTGHLNEMAQEFLVTEDILKELGLCMVKLATTIVEEEYRACREYLLNQAEFETTDDDDGLFDMIQPSLIQQLRTILDQNPDDGQILKELIQNAEDAGARQVKFLYDKHSYGTEKLYSEGLAQFQGPALYAYNNAKFTRDDWEGIRMLFDSKKIQDPIKVGRFGMGFKSVFHITDLPSIVSSSRIGAIDPHEEYFGNRRTGYSWRIKDRDVMQTIPDQFAPYKGVFDCTEDVFSRGSYNGTLFRFPLRTKPSELSQTLYSAEKLQTLFEGFTADAHLVLLFLQHLESIELNVRDESDTEPIKTFQVRITDESLQLVREKRKQFQRKIGTGLLMSQSVDVTYPITIETVHFFQGRETSKRRHSFLVTNYFCGGEMSSEFQTLATDKDLSYLPLVGVAMTLPVAPKEPTPAIQGHVFCFLPLPVQKTSLTGLPVHVNGFFALNQNRRYIKFPNAEQEDQERAGRQLTDKSLLWNKCLLEEAIPKAYATMILQAINEKKFNIQAEAIYNAWPDINVIDQKWKRLQNPLFDGLCSENIIYTEARGGNWLTVEEAIFDKLVDNEPKELLLKVLLEAHQNVASLPEHVFKAVSLNKTIIKEVTPLFVQQVLKEIPSSYSNLGRMEKLNLLQFVLSCLDGNFVDLLGLELLPIASGVFTPFSNTDEAIFFCSPGHPRKLLPCLGHRFLDQDIDQSLLRSLEAVAKNGCTQLRLFCPDDVASLLPKSLPAEWSEGETITWYPGAETHDHPAKNWLALVWSYLIENFSTTEDLGKFEGLPLIPLDMSQDPITLIRLTQPSKIVVRSLHNDILNEVLSDTLIQLGVFIIQKCPIFVSLHPAVINTFIHPPSTHGVLKALTAFPATVRTGMHSVTDEGRRSLRNFVSKASSLDPQARQLLCSLPMFETISKSFVSKAKGLCAAPEGFFPVAPRRDLIDVTHDDSEKLAHLLDIRILTPTDYFLEIIFPDIKRGCYSNEEIDRFMVFVMERYQVYASTDTRFEEEMKALPFVSTNNGRVRALDLFDPRKDQLRKLFIDEDVFPVGAQYTDPTVLVVLEKLGMKSEKEITAIDIYQSAKKITVMSSILTAKQKSETIITYLDSNPIKLQETVSGTALGLLLRDIPWLSAPKQKPYGFPRSLYLLGESEKESHFYNPTEVTSENKVNLIGTVKPIVNVDSVSQLAKFFGWDKMPDPLDVVEHLKMVISLYTQDEKPQYIAIVKDIYAFLRLADPTDLKVALHGITNSKWIWNGDGFSSPNTIVAKKSSIDLSPYISSLPSEMLRFSNFFSKFGMQEECDAAFLLKVLHLIKQKYEHGCGFPRSEVKKDLQLSLDILNNVKATVGEQLPPELQEKVLIPMHVKGDSYVKLAPVEDCVYREQQWLERSNSDEDMDFFYVHPNILKSTAEFFHVRTLTNRMLEPDEMQIGDEFGQDEKLTHRLKRLLEEYTDGFSVLKELIQNADDAGATEVRFMYDERTNEDAMTCLIDEGMRECQGPALWVYNDAEFRDEDFANITKLNGGTKEQESEKIGKFGLGFSAVYNLTDVPMFLSRNYFVIFDPNTFYLGKAIGNKNKPGIKIDINKNTKRLRNFKNQFKPFNGVFGCDLHLNKEDNSFHGTLFRFPLRTREQAAKSEIKELYYSNQEMRQLFQIFLDRAESLLLFTQNVIRVEIYSLPSSSSEKPETKLMFQVTKSLSEVGILRELSVPVTLPVTAKKLDSEQQKFLMQCNFLQASSRVKSNAKSRKVNPRDLPKSSIAVDVKCSFTNSGARFFKIDKTLCRKSETWLVVSSMGNGQAMEFAKGDPCFLPSAGVAVQLVPKGGNAFLPSPVVQNVDGLGTIFCYLPLPMHSGLPVHINGAFSVTSNRRHLQERLEDDKEWHGVRWNSVLMEDSITSAYISLLEDVKPIVSDDGSYAFHSLWPKAFEVHQHCLPILTSFYNQLVSGSHALFSDGNEWFTINQVVFVHPDLRMDPEIGDVAFAVFQQCTSVMEVVIDLPADVFQSFVRCEHYDVIKSKTYDESRFFRELFFPNISDVRSDFRDVLVLYALDHNNKYFDELMKKHACIPVNLSEKKLKCPDQLVNPTKDASALFCLDDGRFPCGNGEFRKPARLEKLEQLGMVSDELPWKDIAERAESIPRLNAVDSKAAVKRVKAWLKFVEKKIKRNAEDEDKRPSHPILSRLLEAQFLPVLQKPTSFPLTWRGDEFHGSRNLLVAPKCIFLKENKYLVCCTEPLVGLEIPKKVKELLKLEDKEVTTELVMRQLENAISTNIGSLDRKGYEEVSHVCTEAYSFLQDKVSTCPSYIEKFLIGRRFILVGKRFLSTNHVAFEIKVDCSPYLYRLPEVLCDDYSKIMKFAGVREQFEEKDYISSLQKVKRQFDERQLDAKTLQVALNMAVQLGETLERSNDDPSKIAEKWGSIYLPDCRGKMLAVPDLCYKDSPWMPDDPEQQFVHQKIPWSTCARLGVKTRREKALQQHDTRFPLGQEEKLTNRLKRILTGYPGKKEILKELLQNTDNAQATEICFIKDPRHHPDERVFTDSWKPLQGPALCVYNNRPFTNADIEGICDLGKGNKGEDPNKTGQYGVGFNAVYHLTDVPSFRSTGEEIGDVLCAFDPHCKYVPFASDANPGRMFRDIEKLKTTFPDVFSCYLEEHFSIKNATMFRFPLKSEKMAEESKISRTQVDVKALDAMMKDLKRELFEVLLFVNNVRKINISEIGKSGKLDNTYSVEVVMSQEDDKERQAFADYMKEIGTQVKQKDFLPTSIKAKKFIYTMKLRDSVGKEETWLIVQQVGFEKPPERSIVKAFKDHQLGMLPRGGVAYLLESSRAMSTMQRKGKAYCSLPLPFETNLPVHINGHFALDHEARRNLWRDEAGGYRSDWNNALLSDVIASCYLTLLDKVRGFLQLPVEQNGATYNFNFSRSAILAGLISFENLFPRYPFEDPYWKTLADSVYQEMYKKNMPLIPVLKSFEGRSTGRAKTSKGSERVQVTWFPPTGTGKEKTFFNNLEIKGCFAAAAAALPRRSDIDEMERIRREEVRIKRRNKFEEILLDTGFNLVALPISVAASFRQAGVEVCSVSPSAVMNFYKSLSDVDRIYKIGKIPCSVGKTPFGDQTGVISVLKYCKDDGQFLENLSGLPLLLTQDNYLRVFSVNDPQCLSHYADILPGSPSLFVHTEVHSKVFNDVDFKKAPVFRPLDVQIFSSRLHLTLPGCFRSEDHYMRWDPIDAPSNLPNHRWIYRVWDFLQRFANETMKKSDGSEENKISFTRDLLSPLSKWSILPATETIQLERPQLPSSLTTVRDKQTVVDHFLVPLNLAESVLDFSDCGLSNQKLVEALRNLGLPELNSVAITTMSFGTVSYHNKDSYEFARSLVATIRTPHSLLMALNETMKTNAHSLEGKLKFSEAINVLDYFSRNTDALTDVDKETLMKLPFFPKASGGIGKLVDKGVFVLPGEIPKDGMKVVESSLGCLVLESDQRLSELYKFLELEDMSSTKVYLKFVLKCFQNLSLKAKLAYLRYLRDFISSTSSPEKETEEAEKKRLLEHLKVIKFIPTVDGSLKTASSFYDPHNDVFCTMLSQESFPPKPFNSYEWLPFLEKIGLITIVSQDHFLKFADQVAREAETKRTKKTYEKSQVLVHHLISRPNVVDEGLLHRVRDIPFVAANPVKESLQALCTPFGQTMDGEILFIAFKDSVVSNFEEIVWTKAHLLPRWADPTLQTYVLNCPHRNIDKYLNAFLAQLQVQKKPSVCLVVSHCQTVSVRRNIPDEQCATVITVMERIYDFLQENALKDPDAKILLQTTRCILVEGGKKFILPRQAVLELYEHLEIKPFLYRVPPAFGKFQRLFEFLGCSKTVTCRHYAMVLEMLQKNCQDAKLNPNEVFKCSKAVKGFFHHAQEDTEAISTLSKLYLPAMPPGRGFSNTPLKNNTIPVTLHQSTELVFDDAPTYDNRIQGLDQLFVLELSLMDVSRKSPMMSYKDLMMKLPSALQPRMLSTVVKEKLHNPGDTKVVSCGAVNALKQQLATVQFGRGIARIIRHVNSQKKGFDERVIKSVERGLRSIELFAVERLRTCLFHNEIPIPGSVDDVSYFQERLEMSGIEMWRVYINTMSGMDDTISITSLVTDVIVEMYGESLGMKAFVISEMLRCPPSKIWSLLDRMRIRKDDSYTLADMDIYPEPGTLIPIEDHHLLNDAFEEFEPGEYVGCQLDDPSLDQGEGSATYIYAIIVEEVANDDDGVLTKAYTINIGHDKEPVVVSAANLYKFHRLKEIFDDQEELQRNRAEVLEEITDILEKAWKLPEEERVQIVKRLFMRWFPKENVADNELYRAAFQHIKNEVSRLGGSYDALFAPWKSLAREHESQRKTYRERFSRQYGSWQSPPGNGSRQFVPPSFCEKNSQPGEAKRWFRQAEADLEAGAKEIAFSRDSYEWACFKCYQAAEKALKAVQFKVDANQKTNDHNLLLNCSGFNDLELVELASELERLVVNSAHMRYPDRMSYPKIPNDVYTAEKAKDALKIATKILERVRDTKLR